MGQIEKVFVISIVLLVGIVLGVTILSRGGDSGKANLASAEEKPAGRVIERGPDPLDIPDLGDILVPPGDEDGPAGPKPTPKTVESKPEKPVAPPEPVKPAESVPEFPFVVVKANETLGQILQRELGSAVRFLPEVLAINEELDPNHLVRDQRIWLPRDLVLAFKKGAGQPRPSLSIDAPSHTKPVVPPVPAAETHTVKQGESLWSISKDHFGLSKAVSGVKRIKDANSGKRLEPLRAGLVLTIPN